MKRTTINLDVDLAAEASDLLGTSRMTDTVHAAMRDVIRRRKLESLSRRRFPDLTLESIEEDRRPRSFEHLRD
ncbi:MAG TPA: type II toxin-antitoxin system VapB family antitoxin [Thermoleophilaceae bacterium]|nr:type II toxin-antitoxin system VapB family antitoxin [Thermoleophilaceae bacterium]